MHAIPVIRKKQASIAVAASLALLLIATAIVPRLVSASSVVASDTFQRTVTGGWGTADTGGAWSIVDNPANFSVTPGAGLVSVGTNTEQRAYLPSVSVQDVQLVEEVSLPQSSQSSAHVFAYVLGRFTAGSIPTYYRVGVFQGSSGNLTVRAQRSDGVVLADGTPGIAGANGVQVWLKVNIQGVNPTTIQARAWAVGSTEPTTWQLTATDSNAAEQVVGSVGVRARNEDTAVAHSFTWMSFQATDLSTPTPSPTATSTPTSTPTATPTATPSPSGNPTTLASDTYQRTTTNGWGAADTGGTWSIVDTAASWSVTPGAGSVTVGTNSEQRAYLPSVSVQDVQIVEEVGLPQSSQSTAHVFAYVIGRFTAGSTPTYYRVGVFQGSSGNLSIRAQRSDGTLLADAATGVTGSNGVQVWLRVNFQGVNPTTIQARAWANGSTEPANWQLTATDSTAAEQAAGAVGVRARNEDTSVAHSFTWMSFQATSLSAPPPPPSPTPTPTATPTSTPTSTPTPGGPTTLANDTYQRTVGNGWGTADTGGDWTIVGSPWAWSASPGAGSVPVSPNSEERAYLSSVNAQDVDVLQEVALPRSSQANSNDIAYVLARYAVAFTPTYYRVGVGQNAGTGNVFLRAQRSDGTALIANVATGIAPADGVAVWLRVDVTGVNPTTIRARAWAAGTLEPTGWTLTTTDSNGPEQVAGMVGLRARNEDTTAHTFTYGAFQAVGTAVPVTPLAPNPSDASTHHYMYVVPDGEIDVYDMDNNHALVKHIPMPIADGKGLIVDRVHGFMYISECGLTCSWTTGSIIKYNLFTDKIVWIGNYQFGTDQLVLTNDYSTMYSADGEGSTSGLVHFENPVTGAPLGSIVVNVGTHNMILGLSGQHFYVGGFMPQPNYLYLQAISTATNTVTQKIGPFNNGVGRPFVIRGKEDIVFSAENNYLGFQVANLVTGQVLYTVPVQGFTWTTFITGSPSHGISMSPDEKELYLMDGPNDYVHIFDISNVPASAPVQIASIPLSSIAGLESPCTSACEREGWLLHSRDGHFVYVGDSGDVIDTRTRTIVAHLTPLTQTRKFIELDWLSGSIAFAGPRYGVGYVTT